MKWEDRWCVCSIETTLAGNLRVGSRILTTSTRAVKEDYHSSAGSTWDILDLVCLESGLHVGEGREKLDMVQGGAHSNFLITLSI